MFFLKLKFIDAYSFRFLKKMDLPPPVVNTHIHTTHTDTHAHHTYTHATHTYIHTHLKSSNGVTLYGWDNDSLPDAISSQIKSSVPSVEYLLLGCQCLLPPQTVLATAIALSNLKITKSFTLNLGVLITPRISFSAYRIA